MYAEGCAREEKGGNRMERKRDDRISMRSFLKRVTSFCQSRHIPWSARSEARLHGVTLKIVSAINYIMISR
jgi:hypothetical protein